MNEPAVTPPPTVSVSVSEANPAPRRAPAAVRLSVTPWPDPIMERLGHDPRSAYVETFWLTVLGPSTTWLIRRLADRLDDEPDGFMLDCGEASAELGLGGHTGRHSVLMRSIDRCAKFGLAQRSTQSLYLRRRVPSLTRRQVDRLPARLRALHAAWDRDLPISGSSTGDAAVHGPRRDGSGKPETADPLTRARRLALTLFQLGEDAAATERQLHRWRFHPSIAWDATHWALKRHRAAAAAVAVGPPEQEAKAG